MTQEQVNTLVAFQAVKEDIKELRRTIVNVRNYGAIGNGVADDTVAFQRAVDFAISQDNAVVDFSNGHWKITKPVVLDYSGQGQLISANNDGSRGILFQGNNSRIFLTGPLDSFYAFKIHTDQAGQQDTFCQFRDIWFYTDNVNRPNGIYVENGCFVTVDNCVFMQTWIGIRTNYAGQIRIQNCQFFGCGAGVSSYRTHDIMIDGCQANACTYSYQLEGVNDAGSDGGVIVSNCESVEAVYGVELKGVHAPIVNNLFCDVIGSFGIRVQNCSWGKISNVWIGPPKTTIPGIYGIHFKHNSGDYRKDYWQLSNNRVETECRFENTFALDIINLQSCIIPSSVSGGALAFINCQEVKLDARIRDISALTYSVVIDADCSNFDIGGTYDKGIRFIGAARAGRHKLNLPKFETAPLFEGGIKANEAGQYLVGDTPFTLKNTFALPALVYPQTVMTTAGQVINFDVTTIIPVPDAGNVYVATLVTSNGIFGSFGSTIIQVIRHYESTKAVIVSSIESASVTVTVPSATIIRFTCNANNAGTIAKVSLVSLEKL